MQNIILIAFLFISFQLIADDIQNDSKFATLWVNSAAEYEALSLQTYHLATLMLEQALYDKSWTASVKQLSQDNYQDLPGAIIVDIDETILNNVQYQMELLEKNTSYSSKTWDAWLERAAATEVPGALSFIQKANALNIEVFYISNRTCKRRYGSRDYCPQELDTLKNLQDLGFPATDAEHLLFKYEECNWGSEKQPRRDIILAKYRILLLVGDDFGDFLEGVKKNITAEERSSLVKEYKAYWGQRWFVLPNPMYGSWQRVLK